MIIEYGHDGAHSALKASKQGDSIGIYTKDEILSNFNLRIYMKDVIADINSSVFSLMVMMICLRFSLSAIG